MISKLKKLWIPLLAMVVMAVWPAYAEGFKPGEAGFAITENFGSDGEALPSGGEPVFTGAAQEVLLKASDNPYKVSSAASLKSELTTIEKKMYTLLAGEDLTRVAYNSDRIEKIGNTVGKAKSKEEAEKYVLFLNIGSLGVFSYDHKPTQDEVYLYAYQVMDAVVRGADALIYDDPLLYWIGSTNVGLASEATTSGSGTKTKYTYTFTPYVYFTERYDDAVKDLSAVKKALSKATKEIDKVVTSESSDAEIFYAIHEYVRELADYGNTDQMVSHTLSSLLLEKYENTGVCQGYARLVQALCSAYDIPCMAVPGKSRVSSSQMDHIWNYVQLSGKWYFADVTWDDTGDSFNYYLLWANDVIGRDSHIASGYYSMQDGLPIYQEFTYPELAEYSIAKENYSVREKKKITAALSYSPRMDTQGFSTEWVCGSDDLTCAGEDYKAKLTGVSAAEDLKLTATTKIGGITFTDSCLVDVNHVYGEATQEQTGANTVKYTCTCSACGDVHVRTITGRPRLKSLTMNTSGSLTLKWGSLSGILNYTVYRKTSETGEWSELKTVSTTSYTDKNVETGKVYYYTVCGTAEGYRGFKDETGICIRCAAAPKLTSASNVSTGIKLSWKKVPGASGYRVLRLVNGTWKKMEDVTGTSYTFKEASNNIAYRFALRCLDGDGRLISVRGGELKQVYHKAPSGLKVTNMTSGLKLSWDAVKGVNSYKIYRKTGSSTSWKLIATVFGSSYTDEKAKSGTSYQYRIICVDMNGETVSAYSKTVQRLRLAAVKPTVKVSKGKVKLTWKKVAGAAGYKIYRKTGSGDYELIATIKKGTTLTYTDKKVKAGKTCYYRVRAYSGSTTASYITSGKVKAK